MFHHISETRASVRFLSSRSITLEGWLPRTARYLFGARSSRVARVVVGKLSNSGLTEGKLPKKKMTDSRDVLTYT